MALTVTTNHHTRQFKLRYEVPKKVLERYDWLDADDSLDGWLCYHRHWMHTSDFVRIGGLRGSNRETFESLGDWTGQQSDGYWCGTVIKLLDDGETYKIGTYQHRGFSDN